VSLLNENEAKLSKKWGFWFRKMSFAIGEMSFASGEMSFASGEMSSGHFGKNEFPP